MSTPRVGHQVPELYAEDEKGRRIDLRAVFAEGPTVVLLPRHFG